jgi:hypothetical protein
MNAILLRLASFARGRQLLHFLCAIRRPLDRARRAFHLAGIRRENCR